MKAIWLILGTLFVLSFAQLFASPLRAQDKFEVFGGYSYLRASVSETGEKCPPLTGPLPPGSVPGCPTVNFTSNSNLNGWEASVEYKPFKDVGFVADFGGNYGSLPNNSGGGASLHNNTYLFGPRVSFPGRISPFVHVLAGAAHQSNDNGALNPGVTAAFAHSATAFALALGGGLDIKVIPLVRLRLVQVDYVGANTGLSFRNQARISTGVVIHF